MMTKPTTNQFYLKTYEHAPLGVRMVAFSITKQISAIVPKDFSASAAIQVSRSKYTLSIRLDLAIPMHLNSKNLCKRN